MKIHKYTSILLTTSILVQSLLPAYAMERESEKAPLTVLSQKNKTAAGILHYTLHDGEIHVLLGRRDDSKNFQLGDWCNFGGGSEEISDRLGEGDGKKLSQSLSNLCEDAARESEEESNGIYAPHPRILHHNPFIDVLTEKSGAPFLYRMYWQQIQYIAPEIFKGKLQDASFGHNKEYTDFIWVQACDLLAAITGKNPVLQVGKTQINIYDPLFETLSTMSGMAFLDQLSKHKTLQTTWKKPTTKDESATYSSVRRFFNRHYHLGSEGTTELFYPPLLKHPRIEVDEDSGKVVEVPEDVYVPRIPAEIVQKLQKLKLANQQEDSIFRKLNPDANVFHPNDYEVVPLKNAREEDELAGAVAAHGMAMIELKRKFAQQNQPVFTPSNEPLWNANCDESISRIHLRIVLGPDYKTPNNFLEAQNPRREADLANIKEYFRRYTEVEYDQKIKGDMEEKDKAEFKRKINLLDSDYEFFADVLSFEEENKQWPTFYHGASENLNNLFKSFTYLRELIRLNPLDGLMALRGTDIYFKDAKTVQELLARTGDCESAETKAAMMFLNFTLFAGRQTTVTTSSSAEYVINDHSVSEPDLIERFEEALALAGFSKPVYAYFQSLFEQYVKYKKSPLGNSVLVAISQSPENTDTYNYATGGGGRFYTTPSTLQILQNIQAEYERQKTEGAEVLEKDSDRKRALFPENRVLLNPSRVMDPSQIKIKSFDRFPLSQKERQDHDGGMRQTTVAMLSDWLSQKSTVMEGSFLEYPALKKLHKMVYKGVTGQDLQETFNVDGFIHLVRNGHLEAVKGYLANYPDVLTHKAADPKSVMTAALESKNIDQIDYFLKTIFKADLTSLVAKEDFVMAVRKASLAFESDKDYETLLYFLKNYDLSQIEDQAKLQWLKNLSNRSLSSPTSEIPFVDFLQFFSEKVPHLLDDALDIFVRMLPSIIDVAKNQIEKTLKKNIIKPQIVLETLSTHIYNNSFKYGNSFYGNDILRFLLNEGVDITAIHPVIKDPIIFILLNNLNCSDLSPHIKNNELLDLHNQEGLTLMQSMQKHFLENGSKPSIFSASIFNDIINLSQHAKRDYLQDSYSPFIKTFGELTYLPTLRGELELSENRLWIKQLQASKSRDDVENLVDSCPTPILLDLFWKKIEGYDNIKQVNHARPQLGWHLSTVKSKIELQHKNWIHDAYQLISQNVLDLDTLKKHLAQAPSQTALREILGNLLDDRFADLLPTVLEKIYPEKETFIRETQTLLFQNGYSVSHTSTHPLKFNHWENNKTRTSEILLTFLGIENIPLMAYKLETFQLLRIMETMSEDQLEKLYNISPKLFFNNKMQQHEFQGIFRCLSSSLKRRVIVENIEVLKAIDENYLHIPYFWHLFDDEYLPLIRELVQIDSSLLYLKTRDDFGIERYFKGAPKSKTLSFLKESLKT